ncbi:MAG: DUF4407 domain-containing protein, partial [Sphingobacteriales bacterium]
MRNWWLKLGCFLTGWNGLILASCTEASRKQLKKYTSALLILVIIWALTGYLFATRYVHLPWYGALITALIFSTIVIQIERVVILTVGKNLFSTVFRVFLAIIMAILGSTIIDQIIFYHRNFTDSTEKILGQLFAKLNLIQSAIQKIKTGAWQIKAKGLKEMQEMTPKAEMHDLIDPLLNDENDDLRIEAQSAYLRLNKDHPFDFLTHAQKPLLNWHQILL